MGLLDRYKEYLAEQARQQAAAAAAVRKASKEYDSHRQADDLQKLAEEWAGRAAILNEFLPLLEAIGAREHLEDVRRIWKAGTVDHAPSETMWIGNTPYKPGQQDCYLGVGLALRAHYLSLEYYETQFPRYDGENGQFIDYRQETAKRVIKAEETLEVATFKQEQNPFFLVSLRVGRLVWVETTGVIDTKNPGFSKDPLEEILFGIVKEAQTPQELRASGKDAVEHHYIPPELRTLLPRPQLPRLPSFGDVIRRITRID